MPISENLIKNNLINLPQIVFEVTDCCNLRCKYCGYSDFYAGYDKRSNKKLDFEIAKNVLDYMCDIWKDNNINNQVVTPISIGFYGGEPLLNIKLVSQVVDYTKQLSFTGKKFFFNMTTNAMLLKEYAEFLAKNSFRLMISLDGNSRGHSYRVDYNGQNSFKKVFENVQFLQHHYPEYFKRFVTFNSVLHDRNSVESIYRFIKDHFGKEPNISQLNTSGIRPEYRDEFNSTFKNYVDSINSSSNCDALKSELFIKNPETVEILNYLYFRSGNVYSDYNSLLFNIQTASHTGTCLPFQKKMFITVNGKILQCERINHEFAVGFVDREGVHMDYELIAARFNALIEKFRKQCSVCGYKTNCSQCSYQIDKVITQCRPICPRFSTKQTVTEKQNQALLYLRSKPEIYMEILKNAVLRG